MHTLLWAVPVPAAPKSYALRLHQSLRNKDWVPAVLLHCYVGGTNTTRDEKSAARLSGKVSPQNIEREVKQHRVGKSSLSSQTESSCSVTASAQCLHLAGLSCGSTWPLSLGMSLCTHPPARQHAVRASAAMPLLRVYGTMPRM